MSIKNTMKRIDKPRSGIAHGGIGTGGIELRQDGIFRNWHIFNNLPFGTGPRVPEHYDSHLFFKVRWEEEGQNPKMKLLQIEEGYRVANIFSQPHYYIVPWISGIEQIDYEASFPYTTLRFSDSEMPFDIELEVYSPFIPHDIKNSSIPAVIFNAKFIQKTDKKVDILFVGAYRNLTGYATKDKAFINYAEVSDGITTITATSDRVDKTNSDYGFISLSTTDKNATYYLGWDHVHPYYEILIRNKTLGNIDDTKGRNYLKNDKGEPLGADTHLNSLGVNFSLENRGTYTTSMVYSWCFDNFYAATKENQPKRIEGNYYSNFYNNSGDVAKYVYGNLDILSSKTKKFHDAFFNSSIPEFVLDQINSHFNTFVTSSWLTKDMNFGIQEGMTSDHSWGPVATTDVGMFGSIMTASLFPELDKKMYLTHKELQKANGEVKHGIERNFACAGESETEHSRIDMPQQYVIQALRAYFWTQDKEYLNTMWESVKASLDYVLRERDENGDLLPDIHGQLMCSYDNFEMHGNAAFITSQWLAALEFAIEAAKDLGDTQAEVRYQDYLTKSRKHAEDSLWNGKYFRLYNDIGGLKGDCSEGCLTDQIIGQWAAKMIGADDIFDKNKIQKALKHIVSTNLKDYGLVNCTWPEDSFLHDIPDDCWNDQYNTCWTGVELEFASLLIYEGLVDEGLAVIKNVDDRHRKFGIYFDHPEFGGHYYRPMSSWAIADAYLGLNKRNDHISFAPVINGLSCKMLFTTSSGYAHFEVDGANDIISIISDENDTKFKSLSIKLPFAKKWSDNICITLNNVKTSDFDYSFDEANSTINITFNNEISIAEGKQLVICADI